jgi:hypothetical protein
MKIPLNKSEIDKIDLTHLGEYLDWVPQGKQYFLDVAGKEHYKLLAYLSNVIGGDVADIGTYFGASALALSYNEKSKVFTFDIKKYIPEQDGLKTPLTRNNVKMYVTSGQAVISRIAQCNLVVLDVDPHDGFQEQDILNKLIAYNFKGLLVIDDIKLNKHMVHFWNSLPTQLKKYDISHFGHHSGTGLVVFDANTFDVDVDIGVDVDVDVDVSM